MRSNELVRKRLAGAPGDRRSGQTRCLLVPRTGGRTRRRRLRRAGGRADAGRSATRRGSSGGGGSSRLAVAGGGGARSRRRRARRARSHRAGGRRARRRPPGPPRDRRCRRAPGSHVVEHRGQVRGQALVAQLAPEAQHVAQERRPRRRAKAEALGAGQPARPAPRARSCSARGTPEAAHVLLVLEQHAQRGVDAPPA